ncbi:hypothetical protein BGZ52_013020, partial [Haplosporangium bisporale]
MDLDSEDETNGQRSDDDDIDHNLSDDSIEEIEEDEQVLTMNNERFTVPEILFNPSDIGMDQAGISEAIVDAISSCDEVGGNARLPGYKKRIAHDLRQLTPSEYEIRVGIDN